jgi:cyclic pyranopterin phosphate synthase
METGVPGDSLTHLDEARRARMVDVGDKPVMRRFAAAEGRVRVSPALAGAIRADALAKGNLLETARLAGILAAKRVGDLVPLCHPIPLDHVHVSARLEGDAVLLRAEASAHARTGVEMEALLAVAIAALTVYDMGKSVDRGMTIEGIRVVEKRGGRSGDRVAGDA